MKFVCDSRPLVPVLGMALLLALPLGVSAAGAGHGSLDPSFGQGGKVTTKIGSDDAEFGSLAIQKDGKLVAAGGSTKGFYGDDSGSDGNFVLVRYGANGSLDRSFGSGGIAKTPSGPAAIGHEPIGWATDLVIQPDGKLVAAGTTAGATCGGFLVVRFQANGTLDRSFGSGGRIASDNAVHGALAVQPDGKLLLVSLDEGCVINAPGVFKLSRYKPNGTLDRSFGRGGTVTTPIELGPLVVQPDGKILAGGSSWNGSRYVFALVRYNANGTLDRSFGLNGKVTTPIGLFSLVIQPDGKLVGAGSGTKGSHSVFALFRYSPSGSPDRSFGSGGSVTTAIGADASALTLVIQRDGKLVAAGASRKLPSSVKGSRDVFALVRYNADGTLDTSFGKGGIVTTAIGTGDAQPLSLILQPRTTLLAAGRGKNGFKGVFALARYKG